MANPEQLPQSMLQLLYTRSRVSKPATVHHLTEPPEQAFSFTNVGTANVELLLEARLTAEDSEIGDAFLCHHLSAPLE
jgi:hypothetical protein